MSVTRIDIDDEALERAMALSKARTETETVNLALRLYAGRQERSQERAARIGRHFERARDWGAVEDADRRHRAEKDGNRTAARPAPDLGEHSVHDVAWDSGAGPCGVPHRSGFSPSEAVPCHRQEQYCASLPIDRYMQSAFSISWSTASRLREVSRSMTSSGG